MDDYKVKQYVKQQLTKVGQNPRRIKTDIHQQFKEGKVQVDMGIVSNSGNLQLAINIVKTHSSTKKHERILRCHGIEEFEIPVNPKGKMMLAIKGLCEYVKYRRKNGYLLKTNMLLS